MGGRAKGLHKASRTPATQQPCWLSVQPSGSPVPDLRRAAINSMLFVPSACAPLFNSYHVRSNHHSSSTEPQIFSFREESAAGILTCCVVLELCPGSLWKWRAAFLTIITRPRWLGDFKCCALMGMPSLLARGHMAAHHLGCYQMTPNHKINSICCHWSPRKRWKKKKSLQFPAMGLYMEKNAVKNVSWSICV